jgi:hypothetical protein
MTDPKRTDEESRFIYGELTGLKIDRSQEEGEPFDMSLEDDQGAKEGDE